MILKLSFIFKNTSHIFMFALIVAGFWGLLQILANTSQHNTVLTQLLLTAQSTGVILIAMPLIVSLVSQEESDEKNHALQKGIIITQFGAIATTLVFLIFFFNDTYFGFEQSPINGTIFYWGGQLLAIIAGSLILKKTIRTVQMTITNILAFVGLASFLACTSSLLVCQVIFHGSASSSDIYSVSLNFAAFAKQLLMVSAIYVVFLRLVQSTVPRNSVLFIVLFISFFSLLLGFQLSTLSQSQSSISFFFNQLALVVGFCGLTSILNISLFRRLNIKRARFFSEGEWFPYLTLFLALGLGVLTTLGAGSLIFGGGLLDKFRFMLIVYAVPAAFHFSWDKRDVEPSLAFSIAQALIYCGIFVIATSLVMTAPYGLTIERLSNLEFRPFLEFLTFGTFMILVSFLVYSWERLLSEII